MHRTRRISAQAAEDLLNGAGLDGQHHHVAQVLRAAAGPAQPGELAGRNDALAAFGRARLGPDPLPRRQSMIKAAIVKLLTVKAVAATAILVGTGGVALAASTGALPNPLSNHPTPAVSTGQPGSSHGPDASPHPAGSADPSPSLVGLCHAYTAGVSSAPGKALDNPAFRALVVAAGTKDNVDSYCTKLLATAAAHPSGSPAEHASGHPSDHPTGGPSVHASGHPTGEPSGHPSDHPTGNPSPKPSH